ncbi:RTA1-like protein [Lentinula raphanica]|nr:RTA1-like protein [Lentinula raphanica]
MIFNLSPVLIPRDDNSSDSVNPDPYGYRPTLSICILFISLFGISTLAHFFQAIYHRKWFFLYTAVLAGCMEILGWAGRLWSNINLPNGNAFTMQIVCTIMAPTPLLAANFVILADIIRRLGDRYSRLRPRLYSIIFLSCDIIALAVQGGGGGIASSSEKTDIVNLGSHIMLAGIVFQLVVIICYMVLGAEFFWRFFHNRPFHRQSADFVDFNKASALDGNMKSLIYALMFNTLCLFIRAIYRTIELSDGFDGKIIETQWLFDVFDAAMVVLAMYTYNFVHPGRIFGKDQVNRPLAMSNSDSTGTLNQEQVQLKSFSELQQV